MHNLKVKQTSREISTLNSKCFFRVLTVRILPYFQEEVMVYENLIRLEKKKNEEKNQIKTGKLIV